MLKFAGALLAGAACTAALPGPAAAAGAAESAATRDHRAEGGAPLRFDRHALSAGAVVVVRGDRIVSVGGTSIPAGARVIDLGDATLLPGFIDAHTHLTMQLEKDYYHGRYDAIMRFPAEQGLYAALYAKRTLEAGFTTVRNVGAADFVDISLRNAINAGVTEGPRMITAAHGIGSPGGHFDLASYPPDRVHVEGPIEGICSGPEPAARPCATR